MNEMLLNFCGQGIWDKDSHKLSINVMDHIRERLVEFQKETGNLYNLEATPAEAASRRLAKASLKKHPDIIIANPENKSSPYFTNSVNLPVGYTNDLFEALELEEELLTKFTGGCVKHVYLGQRLPSADSARTLVKTICDNYRISYYSITPEFSRCPIHGYIPGKHETCPMEI
jgi:ribonucleoside-triphosphate reductase